MAGFNQGTFKFLQSDKQNVLLCGGENRYCKLPISVLYFYLLIVRSIYWNEVSYTMQSIRDEESKKGKGILRKGSIGTFSILLAIFGSHHNWTSLTPSTTQRDITQLDFFDLNYRFIKDSTYEFSYTQAGIKTTLRIRALKMSTQISGFSLTISGNPSSRSLSQTWGKQHPASLQIQQFFRSIQKNSLNSYPCPGWMSQRVPQKPAMKI